MVRGSYRGVKGFIILEINLEMGEQYCVYLHVSFLYRVPHASTQADMAP